MNRLVLYTLASGMLFWVTACAQQPAEKPQQPAAAAKPQPVTPKSVPLPAKIPIPEPAAKTPAEPVADQPASEPQVKSVSQILNSVAKTSAEAVEMSQQLTQLSDKKNYLLQQSQRFFNARNYQPAIDTLTYLLEKVDPQMPAAQELLEMAQQRYKQAMAEAESISTTVTDLFEGTE